MCSQNHRFNQKEIIYDIDGNSYVVDGDKARLINSSVSYDLNEAESSFLRLEDFIELPYRLRVA